MSPESIKVYENAVLKGLLMHWVLNACWDYKMWTCIVYVVYCTMCMPSDFWPI